MSSFSKVKKSREKWKESAVESRKNERYLRKECRRISSDRNHYKKKVRELEAQLKSECQKLPPLSVQNKIDLIFISLQLFTVARISFRAVSRVLKVLSPYLGIPKAPCPQTIINWVTRLSIVRIQQAGELSANNIGEDVSSKGFIWMIDISIGLGAGKILSVLALDLRYHESHANAPTLQDVHCVAVSVSKTWTGQDIAAFLTRVINEVGCPASFLKDGGTDLGKAVRLLNEQGLSCRCIEDISHKVANFFKHEYAKHPMYEVFLSVCGRVSKNLKQTLLACLAPPKVSVKARFMNIHRLVEWADKLLNHSGKGAAKEGSLLSKLRASMEELPMCKSFITRFLRDAKPLLACQKTLKNNGLNYDTYKECEKIISQAIPSRSAVGSDFNKWLKSHLDIAEALGVQKSGLPISTDQLESLFGAGKRHGTGEIKDANRIAIRQPSLCGTLTREDARRVQEVSVEQQQVIVGSVVSLTKQRRDVLPNPGTLESLGNYPQQKNVELIPGPKMLPKSSGKSEVIGSEEKLNGPVPLLPSEALEAA